MDPWEVIAGARARGLPEGTIARMLGLKDGQYGYGIMRQDGERKPVVVIPRPLPVVRPAPPDPQPLPKRAVPIVIRRTAEAVIAAVCAEWPITRADLLGAYQGRSASHPRMAAYLLMKKHTPLSFPAIAYALCRKDHTTPISGCRRAADMWRRDEGWRARYDRADARLSTPACDQPATIP